MAVNIFNSNNNMGSVELMRCPKCNSCMSQWGECEECKKLKGNIMGNSMKERVHLNYCILGAQDEGIKCHPQMDMKNRRIIYEASEPSPISDSWRFYNCSYNSELPLYISVMSNGGVPFKEITLQKFKDLYSSKEVK